MRAPFQSHDLLELENAMQNQLPSISALKVEARNLRELRLNEGNPISHSQALEIIAKSYGLHDWNELSAKAKKPVQKRLYLGQKIKGTYLSQEFTGHIYRLKPLDSGLSRVTLKFDEAIDVVTFGSFSNFYNQLSKTVDEYGVSPEKTSDGVPQLVIDL